MTEFYDEEDNIRGGLNIVTGVVETDIKNSTASISAFFRGAGYAMHEKESYPTHSIDGLSSYGVKVMPTVSSVSQNFGYAQGGQDLTIMGTSLDGEEVSITVDGLLC